MASKACELLKKAPVEREEEEEEEEEEEDNNGIQPTKGVKIFVQEEPQSATTVFNQPIGVVDSLSKLKLDSTNIMVVEKRDAQQPVQHSPLIRIDDCAHQNHQRHHELVAERLVREAIDSAEESLSRESSPAAAAAVEEEEDFEQFRTPPSSFCGSPRSPLHSPLQQLNSTRQQLTTGSYPNGVIASGGNYHQTQQAAADPVIGRQIDNSNIAIIHNPTNNNNINFDLTSSGGLLQIRQDQIISSQGLPSATNILPANRNGIESHPVPAPRVHHVQQRSNQPACNTPQPVYVNVVLDENMNKQISLDNIDSSGGGDGSRFATKPKSESSWILQDSVTASRVSKGAPWAGKGGLGSKKIWQVEEQDQRAPQLLVTTSLAPARSEPNLNNASLPDTKMASFVQQQQQQPVFGQQSNRPQSMENGPQSPITIIPQHRPPVHTANFGQGAIASLAQLPPKPPPNQLYINTAENLHQSATASTPWSQRQWKSVSAPNSNVIPMWNQQNGAQEQQQTAQKGSFSPMVKNFWAPVQSPKTEHPPSQFPQTASPIQPFVAQPSPVQSFVPQPSPKQQMVSIPEMEKAVPSAAKAPPPILPKPKAVVVSQQQQQQQQQQELLHGQQFPLQNYHSQSEQQSLIRPTSVTTSPNVNYEQQQQQQPLTGISLARAQFESAENQKPMRPMLYRPGNQWPPPKQESDAAAAVRTETSPPRQLVQNVNLKPDTKMWTLAKPEQSEIKAQLESVIKSPGIKSSLRNRGSTDAEPEEFPVLRKVEQKSVSPQQQPSPQSQSGAQQQGDDEEVEHLLKPSAIKANQPKIEDVVGSSSSLSRSPKPTTKEALLNQYNAAWDKADNYEEPEVVKCGLPPTKRPVEPENTTDVEGCIKRLAQNDPTLTEINLNNMKRTPIPQIQRLIDALQNNTNLKKLSLANLGLTDNALEPLLELLENNAHIETLNIETNFLTGDFLVRFFQSCLKLQTLRDIKAVNQSPTFSNQSELNMMKAIHQNRGVWKVSLNLRLPEARQKVDQALIRNGELRRLKRKIEAMEAEQEYVEMD